MEYIITGKCVSNAEVVGFEITDDSGNTKIFKTADIHELIKRGEIHGCSLIEYNGKIYINNEKNNKANLPIKYPDKLKGKLTVSKRVLSEGKLIGYVVKDENEKEYKLSKDKVWDIARRDGFTNISASVSNSKKILRGAGINMLELDVIEAGVTINGQDG